MLPSSQYLVLFISCNWQCVIDSSTVSAYTKGVKELACKILELIAEGLGVHDTSIFSRFIRHVHNDSLLRLNHYPPIPPILSNRVGFGEHSDPQIITILRSNDVAGLQISLQDGMWNPVTPHPSAFCVNVGDLLQVYIYVLYFCFQFLRLNVQGHGAAYIFK